MPITAFNLAHMGVSDIQQQLLLGSRPPGISEEDIMGFFERYGVQLTKTLTGLIEQRMTPEMRRRQHEPDRGPSFIAIPDPIALPVKTAGSVLMLRFVPVLFPAIGPVYTAPHQGASGERTGTSMTLYNQRRGEDEESVFFSKWTRRRAIVAGPLAREVVDALISNFQPEGARAEVRDQQGQLALEFLTGPAKVTIPLKPQERLTKLLMALGDAVYQDKPFKLRVRANKQNYSFLITPTGDSLSVRMQPTRNQSLPLNASEKELRFPSDSDDSHHRANDLMEFLPVVWPDVAGGELVELEMV